MVVSLSLFFEILAVVVCLHYLYDEKIKLDKLTISFIFIEMIWMIIVCFFELNQTWTLLMYPIIMVYCGVKFGFNIKAIVVNNVLYMIILCILQSTIMMVFNFVFGKLNYEIQVVINFIVLILVIVLAKKCNLAKLSKILQKREILLAIVLFVLGISFLLFLFQFKQTLGFDILYYIVLFVSVILLCVVAIDIGKHKMKTKEIEAELRLHKIYESSFKSLINDIRARQHEFDNHINAIYSQHMMYRDYESLKKAQREYCKVVVEENRYNKLLSQGNPVILGFLYGKFLEAEKSGIIVDYNISIRQLECCVPEYKFVELIGNLFDNAMEEIVKTNVKKVIKITLKEESDLIKIIISNPINDLKYNEIHKMFIEGYSKKGQGRGLGLYNVNKICKDYNVEIECEIIMDGEEWIKISLLINKSH